MDIVTLVYRGLYDSLATIDVSGGVLLVTIWFQTGYVALFRAIHGDDAGRAPAPATSPRRAVAHAAPVKPAPPKSVSPKSTSPKSTSPWGQR